jgi:CMP-N,N'-diacetyllegionaminic acid synthase
MNASIYIWKRNAILNEKTLFLPNTGLYVMPEERSIDIDTPLDFEFVEFLMRKNNAQQ